MKNFLKRGIQSSVVCFSMLLSAMSFATLAEQTETSLDLTYYTENYPPSNYIVDDKLIGLSVEMIQLIWNKLEIEPQPIQLVPWARGYRIAQSEKNTVLFTMARTKSREDLFKWVGPIYTARHVLLAKDDFKHEINTIEDAYQYPIAAIRDDISEVALIESGFPQDKIAPLTDLKQSILMLNNGRVDLIIISQASIKELVAVNNLRLDQFKVMYTVNEVNNYYAFNKDTPDEVIETFQSAFDQVSEQRKKLLVKYNLLID